MESRRQHELDSALEALLTGERLRPAPSGLRRRVDSRVRFIVMQDRERRRFRTVLMGGVSGALAVASVLALAAWYADLPGRLAARVPGLQGQMDRFFLDAAGSGAILAGAVACGIGSLCLIAALVGPGPWLRLPSLRQRS